MRDVLRDSWHLMRWEWDRTREEPSGALLILGNLVGFVVLAMLLICA